MLIPAVILAIENESDREYMEQLYCTYKNLMFSEALKYFSYGSLEGDVINDTLIKLINKLQLLQTLDKRALASYIVISVRNTAIDYHRREKYLSPDGYDDAAASTHTDFQETENAALSKIEIEEFYRLWPELDEKTRSILECKYFLEMSDAEIAGLLEIKQESVRMSLTRARRAAFAKLNGQLN